MRGPWKIWSEQGVKDTERDVAKKTRLKRRMVQIVNCRRIIRSSNTGDEFGRRHGDFRGIGGQYIKEDSIKSVECCMNGSTVWSMNAEKGKTGRRMRNVWPVWSNPIRIWIKG
jgi:hypothetical protein